MSVHREQRLLDLTTAILASYHEHGHLSRADRADLPSRDTIWAVVEEILRLLFPGFLEATEARNVGIHERTAERVRTIDFHLRAEIEKGLRFAAHEDGRPCDAAHLAATATTDLLARIPAIRDLLASDIQAAHDGDPAARSHEEIILAYPGLQAIAVYRVAHALHEDGIPIVPRVMTEYAHSRTGIDIHPGATIGRRFFIDHGTGVVIGETCVIGDGVKIYQGVTLGAQSFPKDERGRAIKGTKRHPNLEDDVTIYSGATILGPVTIGKRSVIGGNVWLTQDVPADTRMVVRTSQHMRPGSNVLDFEI